MKDGMFVVSEQENGYFFARVAEVNQESGIVLLDEYDCTLLPKRIGMTELPIAIAKNRYRVMTEQEAETFFRIMQNSGEQDLFNPDVQETFLMLKEKVQQNHIFKIERSFLQ